MYKAYSVRAVEVKTGLAVATGHTYEGNVQVSLDKKAATAIATVWRKDPSLRSVTVAKVGWSR